MAGDDAVTIGEVYRRQQETLQEIRDMRRDLVGRAEYEADQEGIATRFKQTDENMREWRQTSTAAHVELGVRIDTLADQQKRAEKEQRDNRAKWVFALVMAVVGPVATLLVGLMIRGF